MTSRNSRKSWNIRLRSASPRLPRTSRNVARPVPSPYHPGRKWRVWVHANSPETEPALDRAGGLSGDGAAGGRAPPADRAAPTVEEGDRYAALPAEAGEPQLGLGELPIGREEAAVFVRVGVPDHDLEHAALGAHGAAHQRDLQQVAHDLGRPSQVVDGLEQRHDWERTALDAGGVCEQTRLLGEQIHAQDVRHVVGHAQDKGADGVAVEALPRLVDQAEHTDGLGRLWGWRGSVGPERPRELTLQPCAPFGRRRRGRLARGPGPPQRGYACVHAWRIVADVEPEGAEPERLHFPAHRADEELGGAPDARRHEPGLERAQVADRSEERRVGKEGRWSGSQTREHKTI